MKQMTRKPEKRELDLLVPACMQKLPMELELVLTKLGVDMGHQPLAQVVLLLEWPWCLLATYVAIILVLRICLCTSYSCMYVHDLIVKVFITSSSSWWFRELVSSTVHRNTVA